MYCVMLRDVLSVPQPAGHPADTEEPKSQYTLSPPVPYTTVP